MANDFNSIFINQCQKKQGIATYLQYKLTQIWPNLYGLSLLSLGSTFFMFPQHIWYPHYHIHGMLNTFSVHDWRKLYKHQKICCFSTDSFPFQKCSIDRILYVHNSKITQQQFGLILRSCWETLNDDGKIILLLPNKLGWWSVINNLSPRDRNSFFLQKLDNILEQHMFHVSHYERILYFPPQIMNSLSLRTNRILEFTGLFFLPFLGGYHLVEIEKNLYAPITVTPSQKHYILRKKLSKTSLNRTDSDYKNIAT